MSYHDLSDSGMTPEERRAEATRIVNMISDRSEEMKSHERQFVEKMADDSEWVSTKQLFWLRDLKEKYL